MNHRFKKKKKSKSLNEKDYAYDSTINQTSLKLMNSTLKKRFSDT